MATTGGPNVERGGLVFGYDTGYGVADNGTATRYYPGKPTSNSLETDANWTYEGTNLTSPDDFPVPLPKGVKFHIASKHNSINWTDACRNYTDSYAAGTNITVSGWHMFHSTDTSMTMNGRNRLAWHYSKDGVSTYGGTIYTATEWNKWYYFSHTFSSTGVTTNLRVEDGGYDYYLDAADAAKTTQYYCNLQIEVGTNIPSPYTLGTRSSTQSLIDLKRTTDIDVSNISFDSTGQPDFDGSDDHGIITNFPHIWNGSVSVEAVAMWHDDTRSVIFGNFDQGSGGHDINIEKLSSGRLRFYWDRGARDVTSSNNVVTTNGSSYHHCVFVRDSTNNNFKFYVDGELVTTVSNAGSGITSTGSTFRFGSDTRTGSTVHNGAIPVLKLHNKALTTVEVKQNFRAYKNRFNL